VPYWDHYHRGNSKNDPCEFPVIRGEVWLTDEDGKLMTCGRPWSSVVHPPDQYQHWCGILEAGGDCDHDEDEGGY